MMKRMILLAGMTVAMLTATAQDNPYIVKTKNVKKTAVKPKITATDVSSQDAEPKDFMGKNFRYYSMCDWKEGMRFMVVPEKYDLLVGTREVRPAGRNFPRCQYGQGGKQCPLAPSYYGV